MTTWPHNHYEPWHIVTVTDDATAGPRLNVRHPKSCDLTGDHCCSTASFVEHYGLDGEKGTPAPGTYRVRYWWDNYEADGDGVEVEACAPEDYHADCGRRVAECDCRIVAVLDDVRAERMRQTAEFGVQHLEDGTPDGAATFNVEVARRRCQRLESAGGANWAAVLTEEFCEAMAESDAAKLRAELVQVAAVCVAWIEDIDSRAAGAR